MPVLSLGKKSINDELQNFSLPANDGGGWVEVKHGFKSMSEDPSAKSKTQDKKSKEQPTNTFIVPKNLEKKLHLNSGLSGFFAQKKGSGSKKCQKQNQRRNRKRAELRAGKNALLPQDDQKSSTQHPASTIKKEVEVPQSTGSCDDVWTSSILLFLTPHELLAFGSCSKETKKLSETAHIWKHLFQRHFAASHLNPVSPLEWKLAFKVSKIKVVEIMRCCQTKASFLEEVIGVGVDFSVNPKTKNIDYISMGHDLISQSAFSNLGTTKDVFGEEYKLFLPIYFSEEHFKRALPTLKKTIQQLCPAMNHKGFDSFAILDVFPKIINTFVVLVADSGLAASRKTFDSLIRIHRLFLALAHEFPEIKIEACSRLKNFASCEKWRLKAACPSLGNFLPLLMIVDQERFQWSDLSWLYLGEFLDRGVLWVCKSVPELEHPSNLSASDRLKMTFEATIVSTRLTMLSVYFQWLLCKGSTKARAYTYDNLYETTDAQTSSSSTAHLNYQKFRYYIHCIMSVKTWQQFYKYSMATCPRSQGEMAQLLKDAIKNSARKGYHKRGMDFSRIHQSGTSKLLAKGEQYSASDTMRRVAFQDHWTFDSTMYLDASCLMYSGKKLISTIDFQNTVQGNDAVVHSGDVMTDSSGTHIIEIDLHAIDQSVTTLVFVLSAYAQSTLLDVASASVSFQDADTGDMLCSYDLESHNKISHLKSIVMCKLYRVSRNDGWHVLAIGDSHQGSADNYGPIYHAVKRLL